jgi:hypothetical protein
VRNLLPLRRCRLGGSGVESAVDLKGVAADDLASETGSELDRQPRFTRPGGTAQAQERRTDLPC